MLATNVAEPDANHAATLLACALQLMAKAEHVSRAKCRRRRRPLVLQRYPAACSQHPAAAP